MQVGSQGGGLANTWDEAASLSAVLAMQLRLGIDTLSILCAALKAILPEGNTSRSSASLRPAAEMIRVIARMRLWPLLQSMLRVLGCRVSTPEAMLGCNKGHSNSNLAARCCGWAAITLKWHKYNNPTHN